MEAFKPIPEEVLELLRQSGTGMIKDALAMSGIVSGVAGVRPARGFEDRKLIGQAATVLYAAAQPDAPKLNNYKAIDASPAGSVLVIDGKGYDGHFVGDNQGLMAKRRGLVGFVIYGGARDIAGFRDMDMPIYCTGTATRDKAKELQLVAHGVPVEIGGVRVKPGDIVMADEDGVVIVPMDAVETLVENMKTITQMEKDMTAALQRDAPVEELSAIIARKKTK